MDSNVQLSFPRTQRSTLVTGRRIGLALGALIMVLCGMLKAAVAQTEICGSTCGSWAAQTNAGPASQGSFGAPMGVAWKGLSSNYLYFTNGLPTDWAGEQKIGVANSWYAESNVAPALTVAMAAWKGQSGPTIWYSSYDSETNSWSTQAKIAGTDTEVAPALANSDGVTYLAWTLPTLNSACNCNIAYLTYDTETGDWSTTASYVTNAQTSLSPAMTFVGGVLYFAWTTSSGEIEYTSNGGGTIETLMNGSSPASTELAPALTAGPGPGLKDATGPFLAWTAPSGEIYYADGDFSPWLVQAVNNGQILSNQAPSLCLAAVADPPCESFYYLELAFTNESNSAVYTNLLKQWETLIQHCTQ
jgi:hypothetical protein